MSVQPNNVLEIVTASSNLALILRRLEALGATSAWRLMVIVVRMNEIAFRLLQLGNYEIFDATIKGVLSLKHAKLRTTDRRAPDVPNPKFAKISLRHFECRL